MTPKEKAQELIAKFKHPVRWKMGQQDIVDRAKVCALIAVEEILKDKEIVDGMRIIHDPYWLEVKQEIEKL
jgi:hypothetical protein